MVASLRGSHLRFVAPYERKFPALIEPYLSVRHPDFDSLEAGFIAMETWPKTLDELFENLETERAGEGSSPSEQSAAPLAGQRVEHLREALEKLRLPASRPALFFKVLDELGWRILRERPWERLIPTYPARREEHALLVKLRQLMWQRIGEWHQQGSWASSRARRTEAVRYLRRVGTVLVPETRGRGSTRGLGQWSICEGYCRSLFRLLRAIRLVLAWPWLASQPKTIHLVCEACGLPAERAERYLLAVLNTRSGRRQPPQEVAREWTAEDFDVEPKTVSNILASYRT